VGAVAVFRSGQLRAWALALMLGAVLCLGVGLPLLGFEDCQCGLTAEQERRLKTQVSSIFSGPEMRLQVARAAAASGDPDAATGTIIVRGPFGIETGRAEFRASGEGDYQRSTATEVWAWGLLAAGVGLPVAALVKVAQGL